MGDELEDEAQCLYPVSIMDLNMSFLLQLICYACEWIMCVVYLFYSVKLKNK